MLACDEVLSFQRHIGSDISMSWVLLHTGMEGSLLHIDNFDVGFSGISPLFFVCGPSSLYVSSWSGFWPPVVGSWPLVGMFWDFGSRICAVFR